MAPVADSCRVSSLACLNKPQPFLQDTIICGIIKFFHDSIIQFYYTFKTIKMGKKIQQKILNSIALNYRYMYVMCICMHVRMMDGCLWQPVLFCENRSISERVSNPLACVTSDVCIEYKGVSPVYGLRYGTPSGAGICLPKVSHRRGTSRGKIHASWLPVDLYQRHSIL